MTSLERLVYMLNQIAANLATEDDPVTAIAEHVRQFWDPRMKQIIIESDRQGLSSVASAAVQRLAQAHAST
ncbi:formate dehydrogenase subunit delta [Sphingorhabdus contaminans]|uniref:formate dehydrogenase subunit delta n=1 Tax=Sphingorhabdus contaminans TaxID=1343899 RepID=UPI003D2CD4A4